MTPEETSFKDVLRMFLGHFCAIHTAKSHEDIAALLQVKTGGEDSQYSYIKITHGKMEISLLVRLL